MLHSDENSTMLEGLQLLPFSIPRELLQNKTDRISGTLGVACGTGGGMNIPILGKISLQRFLNVKLLGP